MRFSMNLPPISFLSRYLIGTEGSNPVIHIRHEEAHEITSDKKVKGSDQTANERNRIAK